MGAFALRAGDAEALVSPRGAELLGWRAGGKDLLWQPDPAIWERTSPILFPVVGWCRQGRARIDGRDYPMPVHGFAAAADFVVEEAATDQITFLLRDNEATRCHYPFAFAFRVAYRLTEAAIDIALAVENSGNELLPFAFGVHPGFAMPFAGGVLEDYRVVFGKDEDPSVPVIAAGGLFSQKRRATALHGRVLALSRAAFAQEALCFLNANSTEFALERPGHGRISLHVENLPHLAVWSVQGAPFVCLEAWSGYGDPVGFAGELVDKPGMTLLPPGERAACRAILSYSQAL